MSSIIKIHILLLHNKTISIFEPVDKIKVQPSLFDIFTNNLAVFVKFHTN